MKNLAKLIVNLIKAYILLPLKLRNKQDVWVIMYHRVLPKNSSAYEREEPGMVVCPETLNMHLDFFKKHFDVQGLDDALNHAAPSNTFKPKLVITFDDGWSDNFSHALPILKKHNTPSTIYLVSQMIGTNRTFWPNIILAMVEAGESARIVKTFKLEPTVPATISQREFGAHIINLMKCYSDEEIWSTFERENWIESAKDDDRMLSWNEVIEMQHSNLVEIGSHTRNHYRLSKDLPKNVIENEITQSVIDIETKLTSACKHFCYPNGDTCPSAIEIVNASFHTSVTTRKGINRFPIQPHNLKRIGVFDDISDTHLKLRARLCG